MRSLFSTILALAILIGCFFLFGGKVTVVDGIPQLSFSGNWETVGEKIGNAAISLVEGFLTAIQNSQTVQDIVSNATMPLQPTVPAAELPEGS